MSSSRAAERAGAVAILLLTAAPAFASDNPDRGPYYRLNYDFEVAQFCGLVGKKLHDAFWAKRKALEAASDLPPEALRKIRVGAMADADREYQNRGLGGYKPWCGNEGAAGVERILGE